VRAVTEGKRFNDVLDIQQNSYEVLSSIMNEEIQAESMGLYTNSQREYYEGGMIQFCLDKSLFINIFS
jgi:hypothetical protein